MRKPEKREHINLFFSAFLILAFIVCANFFANFTSTLPSVPAQLISIAVYVVFGLLLFYATRVGDGKAVLRFSPLTLLLLVVPTLFIIIASLAAFMPLHTFFAADPLTGRLSVITTLAAVALGYGIPYTFVSGFELKTEDEEPEEEPTGVLEGGVEADLLDAEEEAEETPAAEAEEPAEPAEAEEPEEETE